MVANTIRLDMLILSAHLPQQDDGRYKQLIIGNVVLQLSWGK